MKKYAAAAAVVLSLSSLLYAADLKVLVYRPSPSALIKPEIALSVSAPDTDGNPIIIPARIPMNAKAVSVTIPNVGPAGTVLAEGFARMRSPIRCSGSTPYEVVSDSPTATIYMRYVVSQ